MNSRNPFSRRQFLVASGGVAVAYTGLGAVGLIEVK